MGFHHRKTLLIMAGVASKINITYHLYYFKLKIDNIEETNYDLRHLSQMFPPAPTVLFYISIANYKIIIRIEI